MTGDWSELTAKLLGCTAEAVTGREKTASFVDLGGTSLKAAELVALAERELGLTVDLATLLDGSPFARVVEEAVPSTPAPAVPAEPGMCTPLPGHLELLEMDDHLGGTINHLLFTAAADRELDEATLTATLAGLTRRHQSLRSVFVRDGDSFRRRVLREWRPRLMVERYTPAEGDDPVTVVQRQIASASVELLDPFDQPPVVFFWTRVAGRGDLLSVLFHHVVMDGWAVGKLWRELAASYAGGGHGAEQGAPIEAALARDVRLRESGRLRELAAARAVQLVDVGQVLELPSDRVPPAAPDTRGVRLRFGLSGAARDATEQLATATGVTRTAVLLTAWSLVLGRRGGVDDFMLVMAVSGRPAADLQDAVAMYTQVVNVRATLDGRVSPAITVRAMATRMAEAVAAADVPFGMLAEHVGRTPAFDSLPFPNYFFAAHDELVPETLTAGPVTFTLHEGHCGGTFFDATLFVQHWGNAPRLALEYKPSALTSVQAAGLAEAFEQTLIDLGRYAQRPLRHVRGMSAFQRRWLDRHRHGPSGSTAAGPWQLVEAQCARLGDALAVRAADAELSYAQLLDAVTTHAAGLAEAGVGVGDRVAVALPRSAAEIIAVLAIIRQGASYIGVDPTAPEPHLRDMFAQATPVAVIGTGGSAVRLASFAAGCVPIAGWVPGTVAASVAAAPPDSERIAYVAFTSGSTARPKGVMVPCRGVVRLVHETDYLWVNRGEHFLRLAPLGFDASTLEIFAPLVAGGVVDVFPDGPVSPSALADFINSRRISVLFLTAGLFRLLADHRPDAFAGVRHLLTGGDVVPPEQVRALLTRWPTLRISNGYGPTENTTFTTSFTVGDACQVVHSMPIGTPLPGTSVVVLDEDQQLVPPGGIGELYTGGRGIAAGYLGLPAETAAVFGHRAPDTGEPLYRTGDLARWDDDGRLRFLGRRDRQVKVSGHRIELDAVTAHLREHPAVRDAIVLSVGDDAASRRLLAGVVADAAAGLVEDLRGWVSQRFPGYAVPALWAVVDTLPVTANGKADPEALRAVASPVA
ncbi:amino acid adenylation domain-containing protein [Micromonospora sp. LOL_024]|uniref:amino acid adenylation domain-containing protein n=1 Tax=Micromonospora sp. LOL_024 TaxID=3345412 RepID=UPI003A83FB81